MFVEGLVHYYLQSGRFGVHRAMVESDKTCNDYFSFKIFCKFLMDHFSAIC